MIRILRYLKNSRGQGLLFSKNGHFQIEGYSNVDWANSPINIRFTVGFYTFIGGNLITWKNKKQSMMARSSAKAEYKGMTHITCYSGSDFYFKK